MFNQKECLPPDEVERRVHGAALTDKNAPPLPLSAGAIEALKNLEIARRLAAQKEQAMPDIKSEMSKVIQQWNTEPTTMTNTEPTHNVGGTQATFDCIKTNPGKTRTAIRDLLTAAGVKVGSSTSLISQMVNRGNVREVDGLLYVAQDTYVSRPRRVSTPAPAKTPPAAPPAAPVVAEPEVWSASAVVDKLSVRQARAVLNELKVLFGEAV